MSLIYAKKISDSELFFISDTKFTYNEPETNIDKRFTGADQFFGGLKTIILHAGLTVAFAGEVAFAKEAIEGIYKKNVDLWDFKETAEFFADYSIKSNCKTDFLIAFYNQEQNVGLLKIVGDQITSEQLVWIGDKDGFSELQKNLLERSIIDLEKNHSQIYCIASSVEKNTSEAVFNEISRIYPAFLNVINGEGCKSVSGTITLACTSKIGFRYMEHHLITGPPTPATSGNGGVYFGDESTGSFWISSGRETSCPVYPVIYNIGGFALLYSPTKSFHPKLTKFQDIATINELYVKEKSEVIGEMDCLFERVVN